MNCTEIAELSPLYVAGTLDARQTKDFVAHLKSCPSCARDVETDAGLRAAILAAPVDTAAMDARIISALDARSDVNVPVQQSVSDARHIRRGKWIAAAGLAAMLVIAVGGYRLLSNRNVALCADAADDHRTEVVQQQRRNWLTDPAAIDRLAARQGLRSVATAALAPPGYHVARGKLCRLDGRTFLHLVYSDGSREFSFFLRERAPESRARAVAADLGSDHVAPVENARFTALIVTDESRDAAREIANFTAMRL